MKLWMKLAGCGVLAVTAGGNRRHNRRGTRVG